jgi:hypothetical protein
LQTLRTLSIIHGDMGTKSKPERQRLHLVAGFVPLPVKNLIKDIAEKDGRTESQVLRKLLERVPEVKAALRRAQAA